MSRVDCNKTLNFAKERKRMCEDYFHRVCYKGNETCPLYEMYRKKLGCHSIDNITQEHIDGVQKWSDKHPEETMADRFFKMFPKASRTEYNTPAACVSALGWGKCAMLDEGNAESADCVECWNKPFIKDKD